MQLILLCKEHHYQVVMFVAIFSDGHVKYHYLVVMFTF